MGMQVGEWYKHEHKYDSWSITIDETEYFHAVAAQKNGGLSGILVTVDHLRSRAKPKVKHYSVNPRVDTRWKRITESELPEKVKVKLDESAR